MNGSSFIPFHRPSIGEEEIQEVTETLRSGWLTSGPRTKQFEQEFAAYVGAAQAVAVNSCTGGLHLALAALDIGPGDEVITTPMTFCSTVHVIKHVGATPVLADIGPDGNMDPASVRARITPRTKALIPVHLAGLPCDMEGLWAIAKEHGLRVIEDAAHAVGTHYLGVPIGADPRTDAVSYSFYATKNLTTGEGGMVTTHNATLAERIRILCLHGISKDAWDRYTDKGTWYYQVVEPGFKYNLSDLQSAIGIHQLRKQEGFIETRRQYAEMYNAAFGAVPELEIPADAEKDRHCWHLYILRLRPDRLNIDRAAFVSELKARGVGTSVHFIPIPLHPAYRSLAEDPLQQCPNALGLYERIISLPLYPAMTEEEVRRVAEAVLEVVRTFRKD